LREDHKQWPALKVLTKERPLVIGHRGYCQFAPENTLPSFDLAIEAGVDLVELDFHQSKDGVLIVIHDADLRRTTDARRQWKKRVNRVNSRTATEIRDLDAGRWFHKKFGGVQVPTLAQAIERIGKESVALIEHKSGEANAVVKLLRETRTINRVVVQSFDWVFLQELHHLAPDLVIAALGPPKRLCSGRKPRGVFRGLHGGWLNELQKTHATVAVWNQQVSRKAVDLAHTQGIKVWVYTVNTERRARRLLRRGVDGLISDNPSIIWRALALSP
jgi:glycerophosphoryl diester phosphodiesterase